MDNRAATFFKKNGKYLRGVIKRREGITTLLQNNPYETLTSLYTQPKLSRKVWLKSKINILAEYVRSIVDNNKLAKEPIKLFSILTRYDLAKTWVVASVGLFFVFSGLLLLIPTKLHPRVEDRYSIYLSRPLVLDDNTMKIYSRDSRAQRINEVMREYNCPMEGLGEIFVAEADKNDIPWWFVAAIAFQESSCGKNMPSLDGQNSFNSWGWGVYGDNIHVFDNWVRGIETVSAYLSEMFFSKGITEPCDIMKTYTPPSQGSWCEGVNYFGSQFKDYKTPLDQ
jgi:hypothetical protein